MKLTLYNTNTSEIVYYNWKEWNFSKRLWEIKEPTASYEFLRWYLDRDIHPSTVRQMANDDEPIVGSSEEWCVIRAETEFGIVYSREPDEIDNYKWQRDAGLGLPNNSLRPGD